MFEEVDDALNQKLSALMTDGPESELTLTSNAQPAIMANSIATLRVLTREFGVSLAKGADCVAGHSLGEYSALCAAGAFELSDAARAAAPAWHCDAGRRAHRRRRDGGLAGG